MGQERGLSHRVVSDPTVDLHGTNSCVYMDNFYTSFELLIDLGARGVQACGTIRQTRRGLPAALLPRQLKLQRHQHRSAQKNNLTFCTWMDTKAVCVLSNFQSATEMGIVRRRPRRGAGQENVDVPKALHDYQAHMKGVALADQMVGYYIMHHRSKKWWRRIFSRIFDLLTLTVHNAYIVAKDTNPDWDHQAWPHFHNFVEDLALGLIGDTRAARQVPVAPAPLRPVYHQIVQMYDKQFAVSAPSLPHQAHGEK